MRKFLPKKYAMILFSIHYQFINFKNMAFFTSAPNMLAASWAILVLKLIRLMRLPHFSAFTVIAGNLASTGTAGQAFRHSRMTLQ